MPTVRKGLTRGLVLLGVLVGGLAPYAQSGNVECVAAYGGIGGLHDVDRVWVNSTIGGVADDYIYAAMEDWSVVTDSNSNGLPFDFDWRAYDYDVLVSLADEANGDWCPGHALACSSN